MTREEAIKLLICEKVCVEDVDGNIGGERVRQAYDIAIKALQGDMYCPSCGVRLVSDNEYVEPKPFEESDKE